MLIVLVGALFVFGGYFVWRGFLSFLDDQGNITAQITREAFASATARSAPVENLPTLYMPPTFTPLPPCQWFKVDVERAVYRECPSQNNRDCPIREVIPYGTELCIYSRAPGYPEWYVVELNPDGAYRDTVFIHESVIEPLHPTPTPSQTFTPLPTVTPAPTFTPSPSVPPSDTPRPSATSTPTTRPLSPTVPPSPTPTPSLTPSPTSFEVSI